MKNLSIAIGASAVIAGTLAYLFLTEKGQKTRHALKEKFKDGLRDIGSDLVSQKTGIKRKTVRKVAAHL